jgi:hypothetical protein
MSRVATEILSVHMEQLEKRMENLERVVDRMLEKTFSLLEQQMPHQQPPRRLEPEQPEQPEQPPQKENHGGAASAPKKKGEETANQKMVEQTIKRSII